MTELFNFKKGANFFMKCLFTEVHQFYHSSEKLPKYQNTVLFEYYYITDL